MKFLMWLYICSGVEFSIFFHVETHTLQNTFWIISLSEHVQHALPFVQFYAISNQFHVNKIYRPTWS